MSVSAHAHVEYIDRTPYPLMACTVCGVVVFDVEKHFKREHADEECLDPGCWCHTE